MRSKGAAFARFVVVGSITAVSSALAMAALVEGVGLVALTAAAIVAVAGNTWGFVANRRWSFDALQGPVWVQCARYMTVSAAAILLSVGLFALLEHAGLHYIFASLIVSALFAVANFIAHFHWSFSPKRSDRGCA